MRVSAFTSEFHPASTGRGPVVFTYSADVAQYLKTMGVVVNQANATLDYQHGSHVHSILDLHQNKYRAMTLEKLPGNAGIMLRATLKDGRPEEPFKLSRQVIMNLINAQKH